MLILHNNRPPQRNTHHRPHPCASISRTDVDRFQNIIAKDGAPVRRYATGRYRPEYRAKRLISEPDSNIRCHEPCQSTAKGFNISYSRQQATALGNAPTPRHDFAEAYPADTIIRARRFGQTKQSIPNAQ